MQLSNKLFPLVIVATATCLIVAGCAAPQRNTNAGYTRQNIFDPASVNHAYTLTVVDAAGKPIQGVRVEWTMESNGTNKQTQSAVTDFAGTSNVFINVPPKLSSSIKWADYKSEAKYVVSKDGYYNRSGSMSESSYRTDTGGRESKYFRRTGLKRALG